MIHIAVVGLFLLLPVPVSVQAQDVTTVILVRHAEKVRDGGGRDPDLTAQGYARATELVRVLSDMNIAAVHSTPFIRTRETARPVAEHFGLEIIETMPTGSFIDGMARTIKENHRGEVVLVVGHSNTTPSLVNGLIGTSIPQIDDDRFDDLFVVTINSDDTGSFVRLKYGER